MDAGQAFLLVETAAAIFMAGVLRTMQRLKYPLLGLAGRDAFTRYQTAHNRRFGLVAPANAHASSRIRSSHREEPKMGKALQAYRRYRELAGRGEFGRLGEVLDENWIENCLGLTGWTLGLDIALANLAAGFGQAFSGLQVTEHEVVEDGDALVIRGQNTAVHTGAFLGIDPTGRRVSWEYLDMYRAGPDGRLNWHFLATDWNLVRLQLLGQAPDLPATPTRRAVQAEPAGQHDAP